MQRHKSAEKAARKSRKANLHNREYRSKIRTTIKQVLEAKDKKSGAAALQRAFSVLDKAAKTNLLHKNNAANKKSRLSRYINSLAQ